ncbi:hypothetical protein BGZ99_005408 [Dissophora globulifera]|uniref:Kelch repeat-containing protein n=1 Tax=Dissophora globulifera TaxID=979702 RepID=A0A9P6RXC8_9FUNG|nr:hypothetical protein BGZ99_005408 [Dissophora globulifera]
MAYIRAGPKLYVQGGSVTNLGQQISKPGQLWALDLSTSWAVNSAPWQQLADGTPYSLFAGVARPDNQSIYTFMPSTGNFTIGQYFIQSNSWQTLTVIYPDVINNWAKPLIDPESGLVYIAGARYLNQLNLQTNSWQTLTIPPNVLPQRFYGGAVYNAFRKSLMFMCGYVNNATGYIYQPETYITEYSLLSGAWLNFVGEDGKTVIIYGGRSATPGTYYGDIYILDVETGIWKQGPPSAQRLYTTCVIVGTQLVIWGGWNGQTQSTATGPPLIYDIPSSQWLASYTAPSYYTNNSTTNPTKSSSSNVGAIAGGTVAGVALISLLVGGFFYRKHRRSRHAPQAVPTSEVASLRPENPDIRPAQYPEPNMYPVMNQAHPGSEWGHNYMIPVDGSGVPIPGGAIMVQSAGIPVVGGGYWVEQGPVYSSPGKPTYSAAVYPNNVAPWGDSMAPSIPLVTSTDPGVGSPQAQSFDKHDQYSPAFMASVPGRNPQEIHEDSWRP